MELINNFTLTFLAIIFHLILVYSGIRLGNTKEHNNISNYKLSIISGICGGIIVLLLDKLIYGKSLLSLEYYLNAFSVISVSIFLLGLLKWIIYKK